MSQTSDINSIGKIAYLGPEGTYSQLATFEFFGSDAPLLNCASIDDVFAAVENRQVAYGVVPVENSTEGAINNTQDCLVDSPTKIVGEQVVSIDHSLLVLENTSNSDIKILNIKSGYYAVITYSGRASDKNFIKHKNILENELKKDDISILSPPIKATYDGPFTLPMNRRNEAMFEINIKNKGEI